MGGGGAGGGDEFELFPFNVNVLIFSPSFFMERSSFHVNHMRCCFSYINEEQNIKQTGSSVNMSMENHFDYHGGVSLNGKSLN